MFKYVLSYRTDMTEHSQHDHWLTGPRKKGIRSILYGTIVGAGYLIGGLAGLAMTGGATLYSGLKSVSSLYKSFSKKYKEKSDSYLGRGILYGGRAIATAAVPWLQSVISLLSGGARLDSNEHFPYDFSDIPPYEANLKKKIEEMAAASMSDESGKK